VLALTINFNAGAQLNKHYYYNQARNQISQEQYSDAIKTLNELIRADSKMSEAWFLRGLAKYSLNDMHGALADFSQAIQHNPVSSQAFLYRGIVLGRLSKYSQALSDFEMAIDLRPNWVDGYFSRGVNYLITQQFQKSIRDFTQVINLQPKNVDAWINRGTAYLYNGDSLRALTDYGQATKLNPFYSESYSKRGRLLMEMKNYYLALDDLTKAIELDNNSSINYFLRALTHNYLNSINLALSDLNKAIDLAPNNALSIYNRALINWKKGNKSYALDDFDRVAELNPENLLVYFNRGVLQLELNDFKEAISDFSQAINLFPDFANAYLARSEAYAHLGKYYEAEVDKNFAHSIAERHSQQNTQPYTDTTQKFNNLIAFSSDFSSKTTNFSLDGLDSKPVDILPFIRVVAVPAISLKVSNQLFAPIDTINPALRGWNISLTLSTTNDFRIPDNLENCTPFFRNFFIALNFSSQNKYNQAIETYNTLLKEVPTNPVFLINSAVEKADMVSFIASFEKDLGTIDLEKSARQSKGSSTANAIQLESFSESMEMLEDLTYSLPNSYAVHYNIANIYALSNKMNKAIEHYTKAIELNPSFGEAWYNRGLIQFMQKKTEEGCLDMGKAGEQGIRQAYLLIYRFCRK
jgi:tetratricopeptide (TPR) repeat protein